MRKRVKKGKRKAPGRRPIAQKQDNTQTAKRPKSVRPAKVFIYALALAALGGGGYLVYDRIRKKKFAEQNLFPTDSNSDTIIINNTLPVAYSSGTSKLSTSGGDNFPLKQGSKGTRVLMLQQVLSKTNPSILVDGIFGPQTAGALKGAGYPEVVDEALFARITGSGNGNTQVIFNPASLATGLYKAAQTRNLSEVLKSLRQIKTVSDYASVNDYYKRQTFISKTIVTDLLEFAFKGNEAAKDQIRNEFLRMGLKMNSSGTWSLQGFRLYKDLVTIRETVVTDSLNNKIPVHRNTILGDELEVANGMTWFRSVDNSVLKVPTQDVKYT
jgi:hypothetical protein